MKHTTLLATLALTAASVVAPAAHANEYLTAALGWYDLIDRDNQAALGGLEYRFEPYQYGVRPMVGAFVTSDKGAYGYGGLHWDIAVTPEFYISPNFAAGVYRDGDGKDLHGAIEFRSGLELAYQMQNQHRLGLAFNHISNAGIYNKNPGEENLLLTYSLPMGK